jgi:hypothetical protein
MLVAVFQRVFSEMSEKGKQALFKCVRKDKRRGAVLLYVIDN